VGFWFVSGGHAALKDEAFVLAFKRLLNLELGLYLPKFKLHFLAHINTFMTIIFLVMNLVLITLYLLMNCS